VQQDFGYRTIQITGRESYIVSLPKEWVLSTGLKKGSQVIFRSLEDSSLLLVPREALEKGGEMKKSKQKESVFQITHKDNPQSISRRIISLYAISADQIHIKFKEGEITSEQKISIKNTVRMLLGSEVTADLPNGIDIQILIDHPAFPIDQAIRRMLAIAKSMDDEIVLAFRNFDEKLAHDIIASDDEIDRLNLYVIRQLKSGIERNLFKEMGFSSPKEFLGYRIVTKNIENIGDNAVGTAMSILSLRKLIDDQTLNINQQIDEEVYSSVLKVHAFVHNLIEESLKALFKKDYYHADEIISEFATTGIQLEKDAMISLLSKKIDPNVAFILRLILSNSRNMLEYARDIAEVTLNRTVEDINKP